jgi:hypothetical protein
MFRPDHESPTLEVASTRSRRCGSSTLRLSSGRRSNACYSDRTRRTTDNGTWGHRPCGSGIKQLVVERSARIADVQPSRWSASLHDGRPPEPLIVHSTNFVWPICGDSSSVNSWCGLSSANFDSDSSSDQTDSVAYCLRRGRASKEKPMRPSDLASCLRTALAPRNIRTRAWQRYASGTIRQPDSGPERFALLFVTAWNSLAIAVLQRDGGEWRELDDHGVPITLCGCRASADHRRVS